MEVELVDSGGGQRAEFAAASDGCQEEARVLGPERSVRVFVCHDVRIIRDALVVALQAHPAVDIAGWGRLCRSTVAALCELEPQIVLVGVSYGRAIDALRVLRTAAPSAGLIVLGLPESEADVLDHAEAGMAGYVKCDASLEELVATAADVAAGAFRLPPEISGALVRRLGALAAPRDGCELMAVLTVREEQIAGLVSEGLSNKEIAAALSIEVRTVKNHVHNILGKLRLSNRAALIRLVFGRPEPRGEALKRQPELKVLGPSLSRF
jgi:two-component system, NarL family, nitrate/nitrite response regulator NarL